MTTRPGTRRGVVAALAAAVLLAAITLVGCTSGPGTPDPGRHTATCAVPSAPAGGTTGRADTAPGGGGLHVTGRGFTQLSGGQRVSLGALVENTSDQVAYRAEVTFDYTGQDGRSAALGSAVERHLIIPIVRPGQRVPVGAWSYVRHDVTSNKPVAVVGMHVTLGGVTWVPDAPTFAQLSAQAQSFTNLTAGDPESGTLVYSVTSGYCRALSPRGVGMVFEDSTGTVIGGSFDTDPKATLCTPGTATGRALISASLPPNADAGRTVVYPYCDLAPRGTPTGSPAPLN